MKDSSQTISRPQGVGKPEQEHRIRRFAELNADIATMDQAQVQAKAATKAWTADTSKRKRKRHSPPPLPHEYQEAITRMATQHRKEFEPLFATDLTLRDRGAHLYRRLVFPQRRGREPSQRVLMAVELIQGLGRKRRPSDWKAIDLECLPARGTPTELAWSDLHRKFRHAVKAYLKRHKI
jgi:hypothetical protein